MQLQQEGSQPVVKKFLRNVPLGWTQCFGCPVEVFETDHGEETRVSTRPLSPGGIWRRQSRRCMLTCLAQHSQLRSGQKPYNGKKNRTSFRLCTVVYVFFLFETEPFHFPDWYRQTSNTIFLKKRNYQGGVLPPPRHLLPPASLRHWPGVRAGCCDPWCPLRRAPSCCCASCPATPCCSQ